MERLEQGVRLYREPELDDDEPWIWLSPGSTLLRGASVAGLPYLPSAVTPKPIWSAPTDAQLRLLGCTDRTSVHSGDTVIVVGMPDAILETLRGIDVGASAPVEGAPIRTTEADQARDRALAHLGPYLESTDDLVVQGIRTQVGGLLTATTHRFEKGVAFIGMHVDRWHEGPYGCRDHAQLSVNLGPRDRYLVFLNLPVEGLTSSYGDPIGGWLTIPRDFARRRGDYPLVRVRIRPGEAYIAPTENLVHDVSYEGTDVPDFSFTLRGRFRLPA